MQNRNGQPGDRFMLWVDAIGGFWVCLADMVTIGQSLPCGTADVPLQADISNRHARIRRDGEGYLIEALRPVRVDGQPVQHRALLADGSKIELGEAVRLLFRRPHALSATARLDFLSHHRTQPSADAVLLMADACILGPERHSHVVCRDWPGQVLLYRQGDQLGCRARGELVIDGVRCQDRGPLTRHSRVEGAGFSFSLEAI